MHPSPSESSGAGWNPNLRPAGVMTVEYRMARGFESKDVEYQQAERERTRRPRNEPMPARRAGLDRRAAVQLSLVRMRADLQAARFDAHRAMIAHAIATLEAELASLS
jgi:hypothetical protein